MLAEEEHDKYANNLNALLERFGLRVASDVLSDYEQHDGAPHWLLAELARSERGAGIDLLARVDSACFYRAGRLELGNGAVALARSSKTASTPGATLLATTELGAGRVVVVADSDLFGDDCLERHDHEDLWCNLVQWAAGGAFARPGAARTSAAREDPHWIELRDGVDRLRLLQRADGSVDLDGSGDHVTCSPARFRGSFARSRAWPATSRTRTSTCAPPSPTCAAGPTRATASRISALRWSSFAPSAGARTASSTSSCFRWSSRTARATASSRR